jgi:hypothetical protein
MNFEIEKTISNFVESQFPQFYLTEGPNFVLFVKAYYEWMETEGQAIRQARTLMDYRDIDNTLDDFLIHFQQKYLYGIPFEVIINPRYLLKHILDVYRSKGTIQCYKLLFKLIYNQDIDVYLPGSDILKPSDNKWNQPTYVEVTDTPALANYIGKSVVGLSSNTTAIIESYGKEPVNYSIISSLYLSNIQPQGGAFVIGEKIVIDGQQSNSVAILNAPTVIGSMDSVSIISGGQNFNLGDILKVVHKEPTTNKVVSKGVNGVVKVTSVSKIVANGALIFDLSSSGFGYANNPLVFVYKGTNDTTGSGAGFAVNGISSIQNYSYNTDIIADYVTTALNATQFNFPSNPTANTSSTISSVLNYTSADFGAVSSLTNILSGSGYTNSASIFVRSVFTSNVIPGTATYNTASNTVSFGTANAQYYYSANDTIFLQANASVSGTAEYAVIQSVPNTTAVVLYGPPTNNSTPTAKARLAPPIFASNFAQYDINGLPGGTDAVVTSFYAVANGNVVKTVSAINSGKGYTDNEFVEMYLAGGLSSINVLGGGSNYANGDTLVFTGGGPFVSYAQGTVTTGSSVALTLNAASTTAGTYSGGDFVFQNVSSSSNTANGSIFTVNSTVMIVNVNSGTFQSNALVYSFNVSGLHSNVTSLVYTNGIITSASLSSNGSGYDSSPLIVVKSANGSGAYLTANVAEYNTTSQVTGRVVKTGVGKSPGYWESTKSFLNSDKYIQDSYFYQDFSYQLKTAATLDKYKDVLYNTFHTSGSELFGQFQLSELNNEPSSILYDESAMEINNVIAYYLTSDMTVITADNSNYTADQLFVSI